MIRIHQKTKNIKENMAYEVDVHAVGEESKSGDAITLRFGNFVMNPSDQYVVVIDAGFSNSGEKLVDRIKNTYGTEFVDLVISTHPDSDHINGLRVILENLKVEELWMHTPWNVSDEVKKLAEDRQFDEFVLPNKLKKSLEAAYDLEELAQKKGIKIVEPFEGTSAFNNIIHVLGPSIDYYFELAAEFDESTTGLSPKSFFEKVKNTISEVWHQDNLIEPEENAVSARNNSSVITLIQLEDNFLFVGDAGVMALTRAADYADSKKFDLASKIRYQHVPHHGSKRNIGPTILNRIVGPVLPKGQTINKTAFISAADGNPKHPSKRVTNAFKRRGVNVSATCGNDHCFRSLDVPMRPNWGPITYLDFYEYYYEE